MKRLLCRLGVMYMFVTSGYGQELTSDFESLYGENYHEQLVKVTCLKSNPKNTGIFLSLSKNTNERGGMHYDKTTIYRLLQDGSIVYATNAPNTMRDDLLSLEEHIAEFKKEYPYREVVALSSYGNLIMDGYLAGYSEGKLVMRDDEKAGRTYFSLLIFSDGHMEFKDVTYKNNVPVDAVTGKVIDDHEIQILSGQAVIKNGIPIRASTIFDQFDNIKHLFHLPYLAQEGRTIHFAVDQLIRDKNKLKLAAEGSAVTLDLKACQWIAESAPSYAEISPNLLKIGLKEKGYKELFSKQEISKGEFVIDEQNKTITICFLPALNAHHFIGMNEEGIFFDILVEGKSNREGINLEEAGQWLQKKYRLKDAVVIDNGADVMMKHQNCLVVPSFNGRTKVASAIIYYTDQ